MKDEPNKYNTELYDRSMILLCKSVLTWVVMLFVKKMHTVLTDEQEGIIKDLSRIDGRKLYAVISQRDALVIETHATLFNLVMREHLKRMLPKEAYHAYGDITVVFNKDVRTIDICLLPIKRTPKVNIAIPFSMSIVDDIAFFKTLKSKEKTPFFDVIPALKHSVGHFLTKEQAKAISNDFKKFKMFPDVIRDETKVVDTHKRERKNLSLVHNILDKTEENSDLIKLAILMYHTVTKAYDKDSSKVIKIKYEQSPVPVKEFSLLFVINYEVDFTILSDVLGESLFSEIKITSAGNKLMFSTVKEKIPEFDIYAGATSPTDYMVNTVVIDKLDAMQYFFDSTIGTVIDVEDVEQIIRLFYSSLSGMEASNA